MKKNIPFSLMVLGLTMAVVSTYIKDDNVAENARKIGLATFVIGGMLTAVQLLGE